MRSADIIKLTHDEWPAFRELTLEAIQDSPWAFFETSEQAAQKPPAEWIQRLENGRFIFAQVCEPVCQLIGMAGAEIKPKHRAVGKATVENVFVKNAFRNQGVGHRLVSRLLLNLREDPEVKFASLWVNTDSPAVNLYRRLGFEVTETHPWPAADGKIHEEYRMELTFP